MTAPELSSREVALLERALSFVLEAGEPAASYFRPDEFQPVANLRDRLRRK